MERKMSQPGFWDNAEAAQETIGKLKVLKSFIDPLEAVLSDSEELALLWEMAEQENDDVTREEVVNVLQSLRGKVEKVELASLLSGKNDASDCFFSIHAGAAGPGH